MWDLHSGKQLGPSFVSGASHGQLNLAIGPLADDTAAITIGEQVRLWSLTTFYQLGDALHGRGSDIFCLAAGSTGGEHIVIATGDDGTVRILNLASGQLNGPVLNGHQRYIGGAGFTDTDGSVAVTVGQLDSGVRVWDLNTYRQRSYWHRENASIAYSDMRLLATSRRHGEPIIATAVGANVQIWNLAAQTLLAELAGHTGMIRSVCSAELDGVPILLTTSVDSTARLWNLETFEPLDPPLTGHEGTVYAVTLSAFSNGVLVFTGDNAGVVRAWDPNTRSEVGIPIPRLQKWVSCLTSGQLHGKPVLIIGGGDGAVRIWCQTTATIVAQAQLNTTPQDMVVRPPGDICIATGMGIVALHVQNWTDGDVR